MKAKCEVELNYIGRFCLHGHIVYVFLARLCLCLRQFAAAVLEESFVLVFEH